MLVTSNALKINDHFNSNTLSMAGHVTRGRSTANYCQLSSFQTLSPRISFEMFCSGASSICIIESFIIWRILQLYSKINWSQKATSLLQQYSWTQAPAINLIMRTEARKKELCYWHYLLCLLKSNTLRNVRPGLTFRKTSDLRLFKENF